MKLLSALVPLLLSAASAQAAVSFGVNFGHNAPADNVSGTTLGTSAWTNTTGNTGSVATTESNISVTYSASGTWLAGNTDDAGHKLFYGYLDDWDTAGGSASLGNQTTNDGIGAVFQINNMSAWLASNNATSYTITVLLNCDWGSATFNSYTIRSGNLQGTVLGSANGIVAGDGGWNGTVDTSVSADSGTRGYVTFSGLNADMLTVSGGARGGSRGGIAGFVVTAVPEPSVALLSGLGALCLLRRRRN